MFVCIYLCVSWVGLFDFDFDDEDDDDERMVIVAV